jgi:membrane protein YqaA with SNARE-associated domain
VSAFVPVVNIELVLIGASAALPQAQAVPLAVAATLGQMAGKSVMFYGGRGVKFLQRGRMKQKIDEAGDVMRRANNAVGAFLFASASTGLPPFYLVSIASGVSGVSFLQFALFGTLGRFTRFMVVVFFPHLVKALLK